MAQSALADSEMWEIGPRAVQRVGHPGFLEWIPVQDLLIDTTYQRNLNRRRVAELVAEWDDNAFGVLLVSRRFEGPFLIDGQHRREAVLAQGLAGSEVPCFVMVDLSPVQEADIWWRMNKRRLQPGSVDTFKARLAANETVAVSMNALCEKNNVTVMYYPTYLGPNEVYAIGALERIYLGGDLDWVLRTIREGWPQQPAALRQDRLLGVWRFYQVFRKYFQENTYEGTAHRDHLISKMREFPPAVIADKAMEYKTTLHSRPSTAFARALHFYNNFKLKTSDNKLPSWPTTKTGERS